MNKIFSYITALAAVAASAIGLTACQDDFDAPAIQDPVAQNSANITISELKTFYWNDEDNYADSVADLAAITGLAEDAGKHVYIAGRVISTDEPGNVFKSLYIQDATGAIKLSINSYNLYLNNRPGQEIVLDVSGMYIGKYAGMQQIGGKSWYENKQTWQVSFMAPEVYSLHHELNGVPDISKIDTLVVAGCSLPSNRDAFIKYQGQLVRFNDVSFAEGGDATFATYHSSGVDHNIVDRNGSTLAVRTSGYSNFWNKTLPADRGDVVALVNSFNGSWQLTLIDYAGCMNFGNPTLTPGAEDNPYTVDQAVAGIAQGQSLSGWATGYIVGTVAPEVEEVKSNSDVEWTSTPVLGNTLVIGQSADTKDINHCLVVALPQGSALRQYGALRENPGNYKKQIKIKGDFTTFMGTYGITGNKGSASEFSIDGVTVPDTPNPPTGQGDGSEANPYSPAQIIGFGADHSATGVWVKGYIVGAVGDKSWNEASTEWAAPFTLNSNILLANSPDERDWTKCIPVQLPFGEVRDALNLQSTPGNLGKEVSIYGDIAKYFGKPGFKNASKYKLGEGGGDTPNPPVSTGQGTKESPFTAADIIGKGADYSQADAYLTGYIVGAIGDKSWSEATTEWAAPFTLNSKILIADSPDERDWTKCVPVQLPFGEVRDALNLQSTPDNLGKKVTLHGEVAKYFGKPGFKQVSGYEWAGGGSGDTPNPPTPPATGEGTEANPYSAAALIAKGADYSQADAYLTGYIVGAIGDKSWNEGTTEWAAPFTLNSNILIADTPDERDWTKCVPVQLPYGDVRTALNLKDTPDNLGKKVTLHGEVAKYFGKPGFKQVSGFEFK